MTKFDLFLLIGNLLLLLVSLSIHEAAHAQVATWCGDDTAKRLGRLTINPIKHLDPIFSVVLPALCYFSTGGAFIFGGAKPVPVNPYQLRKPARDMAMVAIAGPLSNLILSILFLLLGDFLLRGGLLEGGNMEEVLLFQKGDYPAPSPWAILLVRAGIANLFLAVFNMVPIPPLDGSRVLGYLLPRKIADSYLRIEQYGIVIVLVLLYFRALNPILGATVWPIYHWIEGMGARMFGA